MEQNNSAGGPSFFGRLGMALRLVFNAQFGAEIAAALHALSTKKAAPPPERAHASALLLLASLQREGRLIDFLQQDVATFSDEDIGAAARVVHAGCKKVLSQYFVFEPVTGDSEGATVVLSKGFDAQRFRLTGNVTGEPPYRGTLKHHGWFARDIRMPALSEAIDPRVVAPAELELA